MLLQPRLQASGPTPSMRFVRYELAMRFRTHRASLQRPQMHGSRSAGPVFAVMGNFLKLFDRRVEIGGVWRYALFPLFGISARA